MEGRTIVRPDQPSSPAPTSALWTFNGGPDNRPARRGVRRWLKSLMLTFNGGPDNRPARPGRPTQDTEEVAPSMEGRTIVRPDSPRCAQRHPQEHHLQWRAGQSSGQTLVRQRSPANGCQPSMEGRTIVRPDNGELSDGGRRHRPSMEGRTIVRPDRSRDLGLFTCVFAGACERWSKPKLRRESILLSSCKKLPRPGFESSLGLGNAT